MFEYAAGPYLRYLNRRWMRFDPAAEVTLPTAKRGKRYLLYVHIPFCEVLCPFCVFHRVKLAQPKADNYFAALRAEVRAYKERGFEFADVYVGGGTPTAIPDQLVATLELINGLFDVEKVSVETNPNHLEPRFCRNLKEAGVNRLSVGVQSFDDRLLKDMGRFEKYGSADDIVRRLESVYGTFDTLNVDMIFNQPQQSMVSLQRDIDILRQRELADQVSFYPIMPAAVESQAMQKAMGRITFGNERSMYEEIVAGLAPEYRPSTAWCFSRSNDLVDEYIVDHDEYVGVGSGAFSYINGCFYSSSFSINRYMQAINAGMTGIVMSRALSETERLRYRFLVGMFGLRLDWESMRRDTRFAWPGPLWKERLFFTLLGSIRKDGSHYRLTKRGMYHWVVMMREFLTGADNFRSEMRAHIGAEREFERSCDMDTVSVADDV